MLRNASLTPISVFVAVAVAVLGLSFAACKQEPSPEQTDQPVTTDDEPAVRVPTAAPLPEPPEPLKSLPMQIPEDNKPSAEAVELGELLFFDTRLSDNGEYACVTCHLPEKSWTDGKQLSPKPNGDLNKRHSPTMYNVGFATDWYWDGRKATLEDQILAAWKGQVGGTPEKVEKKLASVPEYQVRFQRAFNSAPKADDIPKALASFLRIKLQEANSPWDRYQAGEKTAVSEDAIAGYKVFMEKAACATCHAPPLFSDMNYHNVGIGYKDNDSPDVGRFKVTNAERDTGAFKTPTLRGVARSAPYFHDGSIDNLRDAVAYMASGGHRDNNPQIDPLMQDRQLEDNEVDQIVAFLESLTPEWKTYEPPKLP